MNKPIPFDFVLSELDTLKPTIKPMFGPGQTGWQVIPLDSNDFETSVLQVCELILKKDPRIGKIPKSRLRKAKNPRKKLKKTLKKSLQKTLMKTPKKTSTKKAVRKRR